MFRADVDRDRRWTIIIAFGLLSVINAINAMNAMNAMNAINDSQFDSQFDSTDGESFVERDNDFFDFGYSGCNSTTFLEPNDRKTRLVLCCPYASRWTKNGCLERNGTVAFRFPPLYHSSNLTLLTETPDPDLFDFCVRDPCKHRPRFKLDPDYPEDAYLLLDNGSIIINATQEIYTQDYCFGILDIDLYDVLLCFDEVTQTQPTENRQSITISLGMIVSVPFLLVTFLVYTIIPQLRNMHGRTLRRYVGLLSIAYTTLFVVQIIPQEDILQPLCIVFAIIIHFSFLASFFWLNVMCFDIWWTFGGFRSLQGSVKQRERKKFFIYSVYAWSCASLLTGICVIMDFLPNIPEHFVKPEFGVDSCWFKTNTAKAIYFYGPMAVTVLCNTCLFISTALKIVQHKKDTAHHLKGIDSKRHDDNKQWFNLYLKLFIVMGINWSMEIISWLCNDSPSYIWYITDLTNTLQGVIIFLIFVWKDKIRRLLLKRLGCHGNNVLSRNSTRSAYHSSASRTTCSTTAAPQHEKMISYSNDVVARNRPPALVDLNDSL